MQLGSVGKATLLLGTLALSSAAFAESPICAQGQDDSWMQPDAVQEKVEQMGYTIQGMGISEGYCYELTGLNGQGQSVVTYLDPVTGIVVQEEQVQ